jgi:hypothetical protein
MKITKTMRMIITIPMTAIMSTPLQPTLLQLLSRLPLTPLRRTIKLLTPNTKTVIMYRNLLCNE